MGSRYQGIRGWCSGRLMFACLCLGVLSYPADATDTLTGTVITVNKRADTVSFIDLASRRVVAERATGKGPHELVVTDDGQWAITTDYVGGNSLTVFEVATTQAVRTIDLSAYPRPHGIWLLPDQRRVAVSCEGSDNVIIADIHAGSITQVLPTGQSGSHMLALPADGEKVYTTNMQANSVSQINMRSGEVERLLEMPAVPEAVTINASGTELWVGSNQDGWVTLFTLPGAEIVTRWQDYSFPYRVLLTRDERYAVIPDYRLDTLDIIAVKNRTRLKRIQFPRGTVPNGVTFHPNDRTLFLSAYGQDKVLVIDVQTGEQRFTLPAGDGPDGIGYSALQLSLSK